MIKHIPFTCLGQEWAKEQRTAEKRSSSAIFASAAKALFIRLTVALEQVRFLKK